MGSSRENSSSLATQKSFSRVRSKPFCLNNVSRPVESCLASTFGSSFTSATIEPAMWDDVGRDTVRVPLFSLADC